MIKHTIKCAPFGRTTREVKLTRGKAIHYFCLECCGWQPTEVRLCTSVQCPLFPYRSGRVDPRFGTDEESVPQDEFCENEEENE